MSRILFIGVDGGGNVPPTLAVARTLAARGHDVHVAGLAPRDGGLLAPGVSAAGFVSLPGYPRTAKSTTLASIAQLSHLAVGRDIARETADAIASRRPDAVVVDCMMLSAVDAAVRTGVPTAVLFHAFAGFFMGPWRHGPIGLWAGVRGLGPLRVWRSAAAGLITTDRGFDPLEGPPPVPQAEWTGVTETGAAPASRAPGEPPLVLVSLSTAWFPGQADVYRRILAALGALPVRAIVTTGGAAVEGDLVAPANVEVRGRVPHEEILPHASLVVGHGGHSTTFKALAYGVPVLVLPMHPLIDQPLVGRAVERAGVGRTLPKSASPDAIRDAVRALLADPEIAAAAARVGERLRAQDGAAVAADRVEALAAAHAAEPDPAPAQPGSR